MRSIAISRSAFRSRTILSRQVGRLRRKRKALRKEAWELDSQSRAAMKAAAALQKAKAIKVEAPGM